MARTREDTLADDATDVVAPSVTNVAAINGTQFSEHALNALRQIPGSFYVLGMFVASAESVTEQNDDMLKLKNILKQLAE